MSDESRRSIIDTDFLPPVPRAYGLKALDDLVCTEPVWAGCFRARQALACATVAVRLVGRGENKAALRDAVLLTAPGNDPGPAGTFVRAFQRPSTKKPVLSVAAAEFAALFGMAWDDRLAATIDHAIDVQQKSGRAERPDAEILAWALGDVCSPKG